MHLAAVPTVSFMCGLVRWVGRWGASTGRQTPSFSHVGPSRPHLVVLRLYCGHKSCIFEFITLRRFRCTDWFAGGCPVAPAAAVSTLPVAAAVLV